MFDLTHPSLERSPALRRFLSAVPPLEQKQCLRAALVHGVRHFLNLQAQGVRLDEKGLRAALAAFAPAPSASARAQAPTPSALRRDSQPGSGLTSFPFVDESRFQSAPMTAGTLGGEDEDEDESAAAVIAPVPTPSVTAAPAAPAAPRPTATAPPANAVFASYPNWWPLNNVVKAGEAAAATAAAQLAAMEAGAGNENQNSNNVAAPAKQSPGEKASDDASIVSAAAVAPASAVASTASTTAAPTARKKPEVIVAIPGRRDLDAKKRAAERGTKDDGMDLVDPVPQKRVPKFRARKAPPRTKAPAHGGRGATARRLRSVQSRIGSEVKAYRAAARRAKLSRDSAMDSIMMSYADRSKQRRGKGSMEAARLANAVIDSGIVADLLAEVPGPRVEVYALPRPDGADKVGIVEESRRTFSDIMNEIELAAQAEDVGHKSGSRGERGGDGSTSNRNYSDWVGDFGPMHTRNWRNQGGREDVGIEAVESAAAGELEAKF